MCVAATTFSIIPSLITTALGTTAQIGSMIQEKKTQEYKTQIALNSIKQAQEEAKELRQTGIEEARKEKIAGIQKAGLLKAQQAASGFVTDSETHLYNYNNIIDETYTNAKEIEEEYNQKAKNAIERLNSSIAEQNTSLYEANARQNQIALGQTQKVAKSWYNFYKGAVNGNF